MICNKGPSLSEILRVVKLLVDALRLAFERLISSPGCGKSPLSLYWVEEELLDWLA